MQNGPKTITNARQTRPAASFAARPKQWVSSAARLAPDSSQNAQRSYQRYLELARAQAQAGNTVGAENYYQYAEHYFRSMRSISEEI
jgi:ABC-type nitrate/sulfonate/bicarbonate transport system substrate-binding protein